MRRYGNTFGYGTRRSYFLILPSLLLSVLHFLPVTISAEAACVTDHRTGPNEVDHRRSIRTEGIALLVGHAVRPSMPPAAFYNDKFGLSGSRAALPFTRLEANPTISPNESAGKHGRTREPFILRCRWMPSLGPQISGCGGHGRGERHNGRRWRTSTGLSSSAGTRAPGFNLEREGNELQDGRAENPQQELPQNAKTAVVDDRNSYVAGDRTTSLDRFMEILNADSTKKLGAWTVFLVVVSRLRSFYGVMLGTFVLSYMGNTVIGLAMRKGNKALQGVGKRTGWKRLPKKFPRPVYATVYMLLLITALTSLSVTIVPRLTVESQMLITKLSEQDNPYAIIAAWMRNNFGEEALSRLEPFLLSVTGEQGRIFAGYPDNYLDVIASKLEIRSRAALWGEERFARFAKLLQFCLSRYFKGGLNLCRQVVAGLTKVLYKAMVSLLFSFMVIWDLPNLKRGVKALKTSRLGFGYKTIAPQVATFAKLVGQSFEVQFTIAAINTLLTTAGLIVLGVSGPLVLSFIVFVCSFVPVVGVFLSTLPMVVAALGDYGMSKVFQIILMVLGVHAVEAYLLNPQIYASKLKLHPVVVICVLYMAEHLVGVQGLIIAVPCAVYVINNIIMKGAEETGGGDFVGDSFEQNDGENVVAAT